MASQPCGGEFADIAGAPWPKKSIAVGTNLCLHSSDSVLIQPCLQSSTSDAPQQDVRSSSLVVARLDSSERRDLTQSAALAAHRACDVAWVPNMEKAKLLKVPRPNFQRPRCLAIEKKNFGDKADDVQGKYKRLEVAGSGSTSGVVHAIRLSDDAHVALKTMRSRDAEILQAAQAEFRALQRLQHPNIVKALDFHISNGQAILVLEYFNGTDMRALVRNQPEHFAEANSRRYAVQLFSAVCHVHDTGLMHRDIKPANVLVCLESKTLMLVDFNAAGEFISEELALSPAGTELYKSPEEVHGNPTTPASDVWSAALCVFFMLSRQLPQGRSRRALSAFILKDAAEQPVTFNEPCWDDISSPCKEFLSLCLALDACARPTASSALSGPWLNSFVEDGETPVTAPASSL